MDSTQYGAHPDTIVPYREAIGVDRTTSSNLFRDFHGRSLPIHRSVHQLLRHCTCKNTWQTAIRVLRASQERRPIVLCVKPMHTTIQGDANFATPRTAHISIHSLETRKHYLRRIVPQGIHHDPSFAIKLFGRTHIDATHGRSDSSFAISGCRTNVDLFHPSQHTVL